jgi:hypothetical protein
MDKLAAGVLIIIAISAASGVTIFAWSQGLFGRNPTTQGCATGQTLVNGSCVTPATSTNYQVSLTYTDELSSGACTCTGVTNKNLYRLNGVWPVTTSSQLTGTAATGLSTSLASLSIYPSDAGILGLWADSGITTDYVIPAATKAANPGLIVDFALGSWDNSGNLEVLFKVNFASIPGTPSTSGTAGPAVTLIVKTSSDDDSNLQFGTAPTTITGQGTGTKTVSVTQYLNGASNTLANNKAYTIGRILVGDNETTFEALWALQSVSIAFAGVDPYIGTINMAISGNNIYHNAGAKQWEVTLTPGILCNAGSSGTVASGCNTTPASANVNYRQTFTNILVGHRSGDPGTVAVTLSFQTYFTATGTGVQSTLKVDAAKPNNVLITQLTQTWALRS